MLLVELTELHTNSGSVRSQKICVYYIGVMYRNAVDLNIFGSVPDKTTWMT